MERQVGFYYVLTDPDECWTIAFYNPTYETWFMCGVNEEFNEKDFYSIGDLIIMPD